MLTILDFHAGWCGPCKVMGPVLEEVAREYSGKVNLEKIDVDRDQERALKFGVQSIPTLVFLKNSREVDRLVGAQPKTSLTGLIEKHLA